MSVTTRLMPREDFGEPDLEALDELKDAVYPPGEHWEGSSREWAGPQWGVFVRADGTLVAYTGLVQREGSLDGDAATIGGLGGIATHPAHRGKGYAPLGMGRALDFLVEQGTDFALLVCRDELVAYYERLGWNVFAGDVMVTQFGEPETFDFNRVMVGGLIQKAPVAGKIDLNGPPW